MKITILVLFTMILGTAYINAQSYAETVWSQLQAAYETAAEDDYSLTNYIIGPFTKMRINHGP